MMNKIAGWIKNPDVFLSGVKRKLTEISSNFKSGYQLMPAYRIGVYVNGICNLRCIMCDVGQKVKGEFANTIRKDELDFELYKKLIDNVKKNKPIISINGMEPLLYKDIVKVVGYTTRNNVACEVTTNGFLLEKYAEKFVKYNLTTLKLSIDGLYQVHNNIRGVKNSFEKIISGLELIEKYKKQYNSKYPKIEITRTISNYNTSDLVEFAKFFEKYDVSAIHFMHLNYLPKETVDIFNKTNNFYEVQPSSLFKVVPSKVNYKELFDEIQKLKKSKFKFRIYFSPDNLSLEKMKVYYQEPKKFISDKKCYVPWVNAQILSNGDVIPGARCHFHIVMGSLKTDSFNSIWNSPEYKKFRSWFKRKGQKTIICSRCCGIF